MSVKVASVMESISEMKRAVENMVHTQHIIIYYYLIKYLYN